MKISLVVAAGTHQGKVINVPGLQLVIGRDEGCHLRPASPAISKKHCAVLARGGKAVVQDLGSTNGTFVNDEQVQGEREVRHGDRLRVGPLEFTISLAAGSSTTRPPVPDAVKGPAGKPAPEKKPSEAEQSTASAAALPTPGPLPKPAPAAEEDPDKIAAMLLSMGDDGDAEVPGGSTVMEMPSVDGAAPAAAGAGKPEEKKKGVPTQAETSAAASEILRKYMRRPK